MEGIFKLKKNDRWLQRIPIQKLKMLGTKEERCAIPLLFFPLSFKRSPRDRCVNVTECAQVFFKCSSMLSVRQTKRYKNSSREQLLPLTITWMNFLARFCYPCDNRWSIDLSMCIIVTQWTILCLHSLQSYVLIKRDNIFFKFLTIFVKMVLSYSV